ncbi:MAG: nickel pincer cofactor biosynthesis protein LarB [Firmicutes bacterium]|nr:nickel pincer cofactor biosynthesis protein LarB [Bacillota bacterium]MBQ9973218.1 nickel pincer cofactor biosynthesis protein LarB [Bacillota bacterium]
MDNKHLRELLEGVASGRVSTAEAEKALKTLPFEDLDFVNIDNHRSLRTGYPEVVFCQGKTCEQVAVIMARLAETSNAVLGTRATPEQFEAVKAELAKKWEACCLKFEGCGEGEVVCGSGASGMHDCDMPEVVYHEAARIIVVQKDQAALDLEKASRKSIAVVTAGTADIPVAEEAAITAETLGNNVDRIYDVGVAGIHRLFAHLERIRAANVVIVVAGMEGALASVVGGLVDKPVIAVPTSIGYGANLGGLSALLSMLNSCANGVGIVNIDNGFGAGYLASSINRINTEE